MKYITRDLPHFMVEVVLCGSMACSILTGGVHECRTIAEVAGVDERDVLYFSPSNEALAHLPYMIALDK